MASEQLYRREFRVERDFGGKFFLLSQRARRGDLLMSEALG